MFLNTGELVTSLCESRGSRPRGSISKYVTEKRIRLKNYNVAIEAARAAGQSFHP